MSTHGRKLGRRSRHGAHLRRHRRKAARLLKVALALFAAAVALPGIAFALWGPDGGIPEPEPITVVPSNNPRLGLVYQGLAPARRGAPCVGAYEVVSKDMCTHGPDAPPTGLDVHRDVAPVAASAPTPTLTRQNIADVPDDSEVWLDVGAGADAGGTPLAADAPAVVPDAAPDQTGPGGVACDGDGSDGKRVQVLYVYETGTGSRYSQYLASFQKWAAGVDTIFDASAAETGGTRHVRYVTTPDCAVAVSEVEVPAGALATFNATITVLKTLGYARTDRKYMIFADANVYCGIGTFAGDDRAGPANRSNGGPGYGRMDAGCWAAGVAAHELAHNLGAVNNSAPNSNRSGHCVDEYDVMCHQDGALARTACPDRAREQRLDCNHDDYFDTDPESGSYLADHWNVADSQYLISGDPPPPAPSAQATTISPIDTTTPASAAPATPGPGATDRGPKPNRGRGTLPSRRPDTTPSPPAPSPTAPVGGQGGGAPSTPDPSPAALAPIQVGAAASTSARISWYAAGSGVRYGIQLDGRVLAWTTATAARVIGLRPNSAYATTVLIRDSTGLIRPYTEQASIRTAGVERPATDTWVTLSNALTGGATTLYAARAAGGAPLVAQPPTGATNQAWRLEPAGEGTFLLESRATGKCVAPRGGRAVPGAPLVQQACPSLPAAGQRWQISTTAYGFALSAVDAAGGPLVVGIGEARFGGTRLLVLQRPTQARHQSWVTA